MVGDVFVDVMAKVQGLPVWDADVEAQYVKVLPGGSALNQARHLQALGAEVRFFGALGGDAFGTMLASHVSGQGFSLENVKVFPALPSSVCLVLAGPADRAFVSCYSTTDAFSTADLEAQSEGLLGCQHLHIGGYFNLKGLQNPEFTALVKRCRAAGMSVSLNTQYDASEAWLGLRGHLRELLPLTDALFVNELEAAKIAAAVLPDQDGVEALCQAFPQLMLIVTRGKDGCLILRRGKPALQVPTSPLETVVDATGAYALCFPPTPRPLVLAVGTVAALLSYGRGSCQFAYALPGGRRGALLGALGLGLSLVPAAGPGGRAAAEGTAAPWRQEIPETLQILQELQKTWPELDKAGQLGGGKVRKVLDYTLVQNLTVSVAKGEPVGANFRNRRVTKVTRPELGWREKDQVTAVNGVPIASPEAMKALIKKAEDGGQPLTLAVARKKQSPIDGIEEDLVEAYMALDSKDLPDLDEVVSHLNAARAMAFGASSSGRSSGEMLDELKIEIDALIPDFAKIVKVMG